MIIKLFKYLTILFLLTEILNNSACLADETMLEEIVFDKDQIETSEHEFQQKGIEEISCIKRPYRGSEHLFNRLNFRQELLKRGISPEIEYTTDSFFKLRGKEISQNIKSIGLIDYSITFDMEKMGLINGGTLYVLGQNLHAFELSPDFTGSIQDISSINAPPLTQLGELWYEQRLIEEKVVIKIGKQDANCDFDALETSGNFIHSSFTLIPNVPMPSYPAQALGGAVFIKPTENFNLKSGIYDGASEPGEFGFKIGSKEGAFIITESEIKHNIKKLPGRYLTGFWINTHNVEEISNASGARTFSSNYGFYTAIEQSIYQESRIEKDNKQGLYIQGQFGWNPSDRNEIARFYGASCTYFGLIPKRDNDVLGFGTAIANLSSRTKSIEDKRDEIALEGFYKIQITPWLALEPDMQYIFNPGGNNKNAFIIGVRTLISF